MKGMRVLAAPKNLKLAAVLLLGFVPVAALETIIASRAPWWKLPLRSIGISCAVATLICALLGYSLLQGKRWTLGLVAALGLGWTVFTTALAVTERSTTLGFLGIGLTIAWVAYCLWLRHELHKSYLDPRTHWYEGLPKALPGLRCWIKQGALELEPKVSRLDSHGAFLIGPPGAFNPLKGLPDTELRLEFHGREARCPGLPIRISHEGSALGVQFIRLSPDLRKELGDFVEVLRGEGHD